VDLRELAKDLDESYTSYFLAYRDEEEPTIWHEVPITVHQEDGLISAEVSHFSDWAAGAHPTQWTPGWNPPAVSNFSGAATYNYPIEVPPGRNGLQPNLALSYNSRSIDGLIHSPTHGDVATGWSMEDISIIRVGIKVDVINQKLTLIHSTFALT
jgi:hypothetical protein